MTRNSRHAAVVQHVLLPAIAMWLASTAATAQSPRVPQPEIDATRSIRGRFLNELRAETPNGPFIAFDAITLFGGEIDGDFAQPAAPPDPGTPSGSNGSVFLLSCSFGEPVGTDRPTPTLSSDAHTRSAKMLYWLSADNVPASAEDPQNGVFARDNAAFRYRDLVYDRDPDSTNNDIVNILEMQRDFSTLYGQPERDRALQAEREVRDALRYDPLNPALQKDLLDIYYNRAAAELMIAKNRLVKALRIRFRPAVSNAFLIDQEIAALEDVLGLRDTPGGYRYALAGYFELLRDPNGIPTGAYDPAAIGVPYGYWIYRNDVPGRSLYEATYLDNGVPKPVTNPGCTGSGCTPQLVFSGYKDLVAALDLLRDYADAATDLARDYVMRSVGNDRQKALDLVTELHRSLYLDGSTLLGVFPAGSLPGSGSPSGLYASIAGWRGGLARLLEIRDLVAGTSNILGFADDFLMLVQQHDASTPDSYDSLYKWLNDPVDGPLTRAKTALGAARSSEQEYRGARDTLESQFLQSHDQYNARLLEIVGARRNEPGYDHPEANVGSLIEMQLRSIDVAKNRVERNGIEQRNLTRQIEIEIDRRGRAKGIGNAIAQTYIRFGDKQGELTEQIGQIEAWQAAANSAAQSIASVKDGFWGSPGAIAYAANGVAQASLTLAKSRLQAQKERLAAQERAEIQSLNEELLDVESQSRIKTWLLQKDVLLADSYEAVLLATQERARLASLSREKADLERRMDESDAGLANRYYADPIHRLKMMSAMLEADRLFREAQRWCFFTAKAAEYKWNLTFTQYDGAITWAVPSIYKIRNADELDRFVSALQTWDHSQAFSTAVRTGNAFFSLRENYFGFKKGKNQPITDPETGEVYRPQAGLADPAVRAFQAALARRKDANGNIIVNFSTVQELRELQGFYVGPTLNANGTCCLDRGEYADKIIYMKLHLDPLGSALKRVFGSLALGGTSHIRYVTPGTIPDPARPDHVVEEARQYSTRYWYYDADPVRPGWRFTEAQEGTVPIRINADAAYPETSYEVTFFQERSVANSNWQLVVPTMSSGSVILPTEQIDDIRVEFFHRAYDRP